MRVLGGIPMRPTMAENPSESIVATVAVLPLKSARLDEQIEEV
jgi:hypothetical protein